MKPIFVNVPEKSLYQSIADFTQLYKAFSNCRYITDFPFSLQTNSLYSASTLQSMSTEGPVTLSKVKSSMSAWRYAPATSAVATSLFLLESIMIDIKSPSVETVG